MEWKGYAQLAIQIWGASKENIHLFFQALSSPRTVIELWDRHSSETLRRAFEFSLVPVAIALFFDLSYTVVYQPNHFTITYFASLVPLYYMQMTLSAVVLFIVGRLPLLRGKASLQDCFTASLVFMANIWPANEIVAYAMKTDPVLLCARVTGTPLSPSWSKVDPTEINFYFLLELPLILYFLLVITPAIRSVQRVEWSRAVIIYILYSIIGSTVTDVLFKPLWLKMYNACT